MAGYTRQDTANNIANGNVIDADDFDAEYNAIESAFNSTSGHTHDGTSGGGAPVTKVGPAQDLIVSGAAVLPKTTNTLDLGSTSVQYKNAYFDGLVNTDTLSVDENATVSGTLGVTGITTLGNNLNVTGATGIDGNFDINTNKFTVASSTGNTAIAGTLAVTGATGIDGNFDINTSKFTVDATSGNTTVAGTLGVTGAATVGGTLGVTGQITGNLTGAVTGNADTATAWQTSRTLSLTGDVTGTVSGVDGNGDISITTTIQPNSVALGTDTTGNYVASLVAGTGVTLTNNTGEGATPTVAIGQAVGTTSNVTFNDVVVSGNLTVSGSTTTVNTETINLADNQIVLNSNYTGSSPTENGGIEIERGTLANKTLVWDETADKWTVGSETFVAGTFEGALSGNATTATTAGTVTTAAQPNITSLGTLSSLDVDSININGSTIYSSSSLNLDTGTAPYIYLKDDGVTRGGFGLATANQIDFMAGTSTEMRLTTTGVYVANGLYVGSTSGALYDNKIYADGVIEAGSLLIAGTDVYVGDDIIMTAGASDWKFEVGASDELNIYYGTTKLFKLDSSGNLTVRGNITAFDTSI